MREREDDAIYELEKALKICEYFQRFINEDDRQSAGIINCLNTIAKINLIKVGLNIKNNKAQFEIDKILNECENLFFRTKSKLGTAETSYMKAIWNIK